MANRILRDWTASESIDGLTEGAEVFFTRLIMKADDFGCYYGNPKLLNSGLFPLRNYKIDQIMKWRNECAEAGIIQKYTVENREYVKIINFGQRLRVMNSKFPQPDEGDAPTIDSAPQTIDSESLTDDSKEPPETKRSRNEVETESETNPKPAVAVPFVGEVLKAWEEWEQYKREKKQKLPPSTIKKQIKFLGGRGDTEIIAIINQSITQNWSGLFEIKKQNNGSWKSNQGTVRRSDAIIESGRDFGEF